MFILPRRASSSSSLQLLPDSSSDPRFSDASKYLFLFLTIILN
jgi:hypothetical protein